ncbi:MAG: hypothetical protein H5T34_03550 [Candidatus Methanomethyliales bacterium]|nr:hypothetical protein [Candidatus Methanomethylicales archaeon]
MIDGGIRKYDLGELYHVHRVYEIKRKRVQKLSKFKPKTFKNFSENILTERKIELKTSYTS